MEKKIQQAKQTLQGQIVESRKMAVNELTTLIDGKLDIEQYENERTDGTNDQLMRDVQQLDRRYGEMSKKLDLLRE